tara:strand:+ start:94 stop:222 length:129 start_codon:yes stop_codon:yes gene_type:complete
MAADLRAFLMPELETAKIIMPRRERVAMVASSSIRVNAELLG